jgi:hypothetical protein
MRCFVLVPLLVGCTTYRGAYQADIVVDNQRTGCVRYEGDIDTSGFALACGLTAIFYGGACWAYVALPHDDDIDEMRARATAKLEAKGVKNFQLLREDARKLDVENASAEVFAAEQNVQTCDTSRVQMPGH